MNFSKSSCTWIEQKQCRPFVLLIPIIAFFSPQNVRENSQFDVSCLWIFRGLSELWLILQKRKQMRSLCTKRCLQPHIGFDINHRCCAHVTVMKCQSKRNVQKLKCTWTTGRWRWICRSPLPQTGQRHHISAGDQLRRPGPPRPWARGPSWGQGRPRRRRQQAGAWRRALWKGKVAGSDKGENVLSVARW